MFRVYLDIGWLLVLLVAAALGGYFAGRWSR